MARVLSRRIRSLLKKPRGSPGSLSSSQKASTKEGLIFPNFLLLKRKKFRSSYSEARFSSPLVLIKEVDTLPCAYWDDGFLAYRHQIIGIHAPESEREELRRFYRQFETHKNVLQALCAIYGTRALSGKATSILKRDIDVLPWPETASAWRLNWWEKLLCDEIVEFTAEFVRLGQNSKLLREQVSAAAMKDICRHLSEDARIGLFQLTSQSLRYARRPAYQAFCFGDEPKLEWPADWNAPLQDVVYRNFGEALRSVRILRFYERNTIIVVKPDRLRYWVPSTAIRDADETLGDLQRQGY